MMAFNFTQLSKPSHSLLSLALLVSLSTLGCAEDIGFDDDGAEAEDSSGDEAPGDEESGGDEAGGEATHEALGGGVVRTTVDASQEGAWIYLDLDAQLIVDAGEGGWELGFQRFEIVVNGGISGDEGTEVAVLDGVSFETLSAVPDDALWITDADDGDDEDSDPDLALFDWYDYDFMTHLLSPKDRVYLVRNGEGAVFKVQLANYYSENGTGGFVQFYWAPLG